MGRAAEIVGTRGRAYIAKGKYVSIVVFSTSIMEMDLLIRTFGGNRYVHGSGWIWVLGRRSQLLTLKGLLDEWGVENERLTECLSE